MFDIISTSCVLVTVAIDLIHDLSKKELWVGSITDDGILRSSSRYTCDAPLTNLQRLTPLCTCRRIRALSGVLQTRKISGMIIGIHAVALFFGRAFWGENR